ncbi:MAG TPA: GNAT family N-acetyltransferase [Candidatus Polarisedimenticolaceae bacterium]|nr:GNAT family N-acetyltransferase [Candidatus Polarisedimenticolaceae bacterium]
MPQLEIHELAAAELSSAAAVLGRGMRDNPLHVRVFGEDPARREESLTRFFLPVLRGIARKGIVLGGYRGDALVGVCAMARPGRCQPSVAEKMRLAPGLIAREGRTTLHRVLEWTGAWSKHDPTDPHWHLGPIAVDRTAQGQGIGSALLEAFARRMDERRATAYLETDKEANVRLYERLGFTVQGEEAVLGVPNWYMMRTPLSAARSRGTVAEERPAVKHVLETALYCDDLEKTTRFYCDVLGLMPLFADTRLTALDAGHGTVLLLFRRGGSLAPMPFPGGIIPPHDAAGPAHVAFAVGASEMESWERRLESAGIATDGRVNWERGGRSIYFRDPEGHSIELATPGTWPTY